MLPENEKAGKVWLLCQRQLRIQPFTGEPLGLDMPGVKAVLDIHGMTLDEEDFAKLQIIESVFIEGVRELREKLNPQTGK